MATLAAVLRAYNKLQDEKTEKQKMDFLNLIKKITKTSFLSCNYSISDHKGLRAIIQALDDAKCYEEAQIVFRTAEKENIIKSFDYRNIQQNCYMIDFHDFHVALVKVAIREPFFKLAKDYQKSIKIFPENIKGIIFITGKGNNTPEKQEAILTAATNDFLENEFTPPFKPEYHIYKGKKNEGAIIVKKEQIERWMKSNIEQKLKKSKIKKKN